MIRAKSIEQFADWVQETKFELADLCDAIEYDAESMEGAMSFIDPPELHLNEPTQQFKNENYVFGNQSFLLINMVDRYDKTLLPFKSLLIQINDA